MNCLKCDIPKVYHPTDRDPRLDHYFVTESSARMVVVAHAFMDRVKDRTRPTPTRRTP